MTTEVLGRWLCKPTFRGDHPPEKGKPSAGWALGEPEKGLEPSTSTLARRLGSFSPSESVTEMSRDAGLPSQEVSGRPPSSRSSGEKSGDEILAAWRPRFRRVSWASSPTLKTRVGR
jgi:hypothetical protein